jgi:hypothetical protein
VYKPDTWTATIELFEDSSYTIPTDSYPINNIVYYTVHIEDEHGGPLYYNLEHEYAYSYVVIQGDEIYIDDLYLDYYGDDHDNFRLWESSYEEGTHTLKIKYPFGDDIMDTTNFDVYEPSYTATIKTYTDHTHDTETRIYQTNSQVYWKAHIEDQHGRNLSEGSDVYRLIEHGDTPNMADAGSVDEHGNISGSFPLYPYWIEEEQIGLYTIKLGKYEWWDYGDLYSGSLDFEVISIKITPERYPQRYAQGEQITITITTKIYEEDIDVIMYNDEGSVIAKWEDESLANKIWTKSYVLGETLADGDYVLYINESTSGRTLGIIEFEIQKYTLIAQPERMNIKHFQGSSVGVLLGSSILVFQRPHRKFMMEIFMYGPMIQVIIPLLCSGIFRLAI